MWFKNVDINGKAGFTSDIFLTSITKKLTPKYTYVEANSYAYLTVCYQAEIISFFLSYPKILYVFFFFLPIFVTRSAQCVLFHYGCVNILSCNLKLNNFRN